MRRNLDSIANSRWNIFPSNTQGNDGIDSGTASIIIKQQARRIDELERANASLLDKLDKAIPSPTVDN